MNNNNEYLDPGKNIDPLIKTEPLIKMYHESQMSPVL